jgi:hypothetical protein
LAPHGPRSRKRPGSIGRPTETVPTLHKRRHVMLNPPQDRRMGKANLAFGHHDHEPIRRQSLFVQSRKANLGQHRSLRYHRDHVWEQSAPFRVIETAAAARKPPTRAAAVLLGWQRHPLFSTAISWRKPTWPKTPRRWPCRRNVKIICRNAAVCWTGGSVVSPTHCATTASKTSRHTLRRLIPPAPRPRSPRHRFSASIGRTTPMQQRASSFSPGLRSNLPFGHDW